MFDKQARFWIGEFDGEKECAAGNEVSAITRHRIFVFGLSVGEGMACCLRFLTSLKLALSDDIGGRLKALASTKLKRQTVNQATACVRTAHILRMGFRFYTGYGLLFDRLPFLIFSNFISSFFYCITKINQRFSQLTVSISRIIFTKMYVSHGAD